MKALLPLVVLLIAAPLAPAQINWTVTISDPTNTYVGIHDAIRTNLVAAGLDWSRRFQGAGTINVNLSFADIGTADGGAASSAYNHTNNGIAVYDWGSASLFTGSATPTTNTAINVRIGNSFSNIMWWDPNPATRTAAIPSGMVDGYSVMLHEIGHGLTFNGWRNGTTGALPGSYMSTFDEKVERRSDGYLYFTGANASAAYGGAVPLTLGNYGHYGNASGPGSSLRGVSLMNGVESYYQYRWNISALDEGIMRDVGFRPVPEPASLAALGLGALALLRRRRSGTRG